MTAGDKVVVLAVVPAGDALATAELVPAIRRTAAAEVGVPAVDRRGAAEAVRAGDEVLVDSRGGQWIPCDSEMVSPTVVKSYSLSPLLGTLCGDRILPTWHPICGRGGRSQIGIGRDRTVEAGRSTFVTGHGAQERMSQEWTSDKPDVALCLNRRFSRNGGACGCARRCCGPENRAISVCHQFLTLVPVLSKSGLCGKSTVFTAGLPRIPHSNSCKRVPNRPLRPRRGRFGTILQQLECGISWRTAVHMKSGSWG